MLEGWGGAEQREDKGVGGIGKTVIAYSIKYTLKKEKEMQIIY